MTSTSKTSVKFSIVMPVYNVDSQYLAKAVNSVIKQTYSNWELCIADDGSTNKETLTYLKNIKNKKIKIKFLEKNSGISHASNEALSLTTGEYIVLLDNDDELTKDALQENYQVILEKKSDIIYSDEAFCDKESNIVGTHHKPNYSPETLLSHNYICHLFCCKKSIIHEVGGFRRGFEGSQDHDLVLRCVEKTQAIYHIPKILYLWRMLPTSVAGNPFAKLYAWDNGIKAVQEALERRLIKGSVGKGLRRHKYRVIREIIGTPLVSIIICFKDNPELLKNCIYSIQERTKYQNYEIIAINNNSTDQEIFKLMKKFSKEGIQFFEYSDEFNYSKINNYGVSLAKGEHIVLLNNDIEIISEDWLECLLEHSQTEGVGAVGAKLYYRNDTIQHAGIIVAIEGVAWHAHKKQNKNYQGYADRAIIVQNISAVTAALLMVKKNLYLEISGLNEELAVAFNDVDFCLRLQEQGYQNIFTPYCEAYHLESYTRGYEDTPEKIVRFKKEGDFMKKRHSKILIEGDPYYNHNLSLNTEKMMKKGKSWCWKILSWSWRKSKKIYNKFKKITNLRKDLNQKNIKKSNILIVGLPKTGTTALYYKIQKSVDKSYQGFFEPQDKHITSLCIDTGNLLVKTLIGQKQIDIIETKFDKKILLVRDMRDIFISSLLYGNGYHSPEEIDISKYLDGLRRKEQQPNSISTVDLMNEIKNTNVCLKSCNTFISFYKTHSDYFILKYEDLVNNRLDDLDTYLGLRVTHEIDVVPHMVRRVIRTKQSGSWRDWFTEKDIRVLKPLLKEYMDMFNYDYGDWNLNVPQVIPPKYCSEYFLDLINQRKKIKK